MYYKLKKASFKNGKVTVTVADSNVTPLTYRTTEYHGSVPEFLFSLYEGNFHLNKTKENAKLQSILNLLTNCEQLLTNAGVTWELNQKLELGDFNNAMYSACGIYGRCLVNNDWDEPEKVGKEVGEMLNVFIELGKKNIEKVQKEDEKNGVIRATSASMSIFEDQNGNEIVMIHPYDRKGFILGPAADYKGGKLITVKENVVDLGEESDGLYSYLSFSGVNLTKEQIIDRYHNESCFDAIDKIVEKTASAGLSFAPGKEPYVGYTAEHWFGA